MLLNVLFAFNSILAASLNIYSTYKSYNLKSPDYIKTTIHIYINHVIFSKLINHLKCNSVSIFKSSNTYSSAKTHSHIQYKENSYLFSPYIHLLIHTLW